MTHPPAFDPVPLAQALVRIPSVTPDCGAALDYLQGVLTEAGFACRRMPFSEPGTPDVDNLFARLGDAHPHFAFAGHIDTVPVGEASRWTDDPFSGDIKNGMLFGRGAADMKSAVAAFACAARRVKEAGALKGSVSLIITGDEEGPSVNGTKKMLAALARSGDKPDHCLVGEPTSSARLGDMLKNGRRGSVTARLTVTGAQGHVAYPHLADNPIPKMVDILARLDAVTLDKGTANFQPSNLEVTTVDVGNPATNVIPAAVRATMNVRHNTQQTPEGLERLIRGICDSVIQARGGSYTLAVEVGGACFHTAPGPFTSLLAGAIREVAGIVPEFSTSGGTSDARFIKDYCPVAEFGLVGTSMHKVDEHAPIADIRKLADIYALVLTRYFAAGGLA